jgi:hypothetical protein
VLDSLSSEGEAKVLNLRRDVLEGVASLEIRVDSVLALFLGRGEREQEVLYREVIWRVPLGNRIALLLRYINDCDLIDRYPFLAPLTDVIAMRNVFAHMLLDIFESTDEVLVFIGRRQGDAKRHEVRMEHLSKFDSMLHHASVDLRLLQKYLSDSHQVHPPKPAPRELTGEVSDE